MGEYTTNNYFWKPAYREDGPAAYNSYNAALNATDTFLASLESLPALIAGWAIEDQIVTLIPVTCTYSDNNTFTLPGDYTSRFPANAVVQIHVAAGMVYSTVASSSYAAPTTTVNINDTVLTDPITRVYVVATRDGLWPNGPGYVVARDYGTTRAALEAADAVAAAAGKDLLITYAFPIDDDVTLAAPKVTVQPGVPFAISTTKTLTINGSFHAGLYQIFSCAGTGRVLFAAGSAKEVYPEWWGAYSDGTNAAATYAAIQAAVNSGYNPVSLPVANGNYAIDTSQILITNVVSQQFKMAIGSKITYSGTDAAIKVYVGGGGGSIYGLILDLYDIWSQTAAYAIKVVGDGTTVGGDAGIARSKISAHQFFGFSAAGFYTKDCLFCENEIDIKNMQCVYPGDPNTNWATAQGYHFDAPADWLAKNYIHEANKIKTITVNCRVAINAPYDFGMNNVDVGIDLGAETYDADFTMYTIGQSKNILNLNVVAPVQGVKTTLHLLADATGNTIIASPWFFGGIIDDSPAGSNMFVTIAPTYNLLKNPSFEWWNGAYSPTYWTTAFNSTRTQETADVRHGKSALVLTSAGTGIGVTSQALPTSVIGETITVSGWFKGNSANTILPLIQLEDSAGGDGVTVPNDDKWHSLAINRTVDGGSTSPLLAIYCDSAGTEAAGQVVMADGLAVVIGSDPVMVKPDEDHKILTAIATWDPGSTAAGAIATVDLDCIGAEVGDPVSVGFAGSGVIAGCIFNASVKTADTVTVTFVNHSATNPLDLGSGTVTVKVHKII